MTKCHFNIFHMWASLDRRADRPLGETLGIRRTRNLSKGSLLPRGTTSQVPHQTSLHSAAQGQGRQRWKIQKSDRRARTKMTPAYRRSRLSSEECRQFNSIRSQKRREELDRNRSLTARSLHSMTWHGKAPPPLLDVCPDET